MSCLPACVTFLRVLALAFLPAAARIPAGVPVVVYRTRCDGLDGGSHRVRPLLAAMVGIVTRLDGRIEQAAVSLLVTLSVCTAEPLTEMVLSAPRLKVGALRLYTCGGGGGRQSTGQLAPVSAPSHSPSPHSASGTALTRQARPLLASTQASLPSAFAPRLPAISGPRRPRYS